MIIQIILLSILLFLALYGANDIFRRYPHFTAFFFLLLPILLIPWGVYYMHYDWFWWMKTYSVPAAIGLMLAFQYTRFNQVRFVRSLFWLILTLNILEAVVFGYTKNAASVGYVLAYLNSIAGVVLILTIPSTDEITIDLKSRDFLWTMPWGWIIGYTLWNISFAYLAFPDLAIRQVPVLLMPLLLEFFKRGLWFQTRAYTLGFYLIFRFIYEPTFKIYEIPNFYHSTLAQCLVYGTVIWILGYLTTMYCQYYSKMHKSG